MSPNDSGNIFVKEGDITEDDSQALVNTVNCEGFMGAGLAKHFKEKFKSFGLFEAYKDACEQNLVQTGKMHLVTLHQSMQSSLDFGETDQITAALYIINFPTKDKWREDSKLEYITEGLDDLRKVITIHKIESIAVPPLGCGLGGLNWKDVEPEIRERLGNIIVNDKKVILNIYQPI